MWLLETKSVPALRDWAGLPQEDEAALTALVTRVRKDKMLSALYEQGTDLLYEKNAAGEYESLATWTPPVTEEAGLSLLVALAALPSVRVAHALRKVDDRITRAVCRDIGIVAARWKAVYATPEQPLGIERWLLPWFRLIASGELYRLGRLQFVRGSFGEPLIAYRAHATGAVTLLAADGDLFDRDGYRTTVEAPGGFQTRLVHQNGSITGNVISARGLATKEIVTLSLGEGEIILQSGDPVLEIHIPEGEALDLSACRESVAAARSFFPARYPGEPRARAFTCSSWLLDPAWQDRLPEDSNIVRFQKEGILYPVESGRREGVYYIFYRNDPDPRTTARTTRMQRIMLEAIENDAPLRAGGLLIL